MILFRLVCVGGPDEGREFGVSESGATIGRDPDLGVALGDDSVSREHAEIRISEEGVEVVDLGSSNGMCVNGRPVSSTPLRIGDRIQLGDTHLLVKESEAQPTGRETRRITAKLFAREPEPETEAETPIPGPFTDIFLHGSDAMRALSEEATRIDGEYGRSGVVMKAGAIKVTCMEGPDRGKLCTPLARRAVLGTDPAADICLKTPGAAFHHAELIPAPGRKLILRDLGSKHGTFIDDRRIQETELALGSVFQIGHSKFIVHL